MHIDWAALGQVFGVSLVATVGLVGIFTLGIVAGSPRAAGTAPSALARTGAYACYALCLAAVAYGIFLIAAGRTVSVRGYGSIPYPLTAGAARRLRRRSRAS